MDGPYPSQNGIAISIEPQDFSRVLFVDFLLIFDRCRDVVDDADRFADKAGAFFWVEGHVGAKQHMIRAEECEAAFGRGQGSAQGRVSVKHSKIVKRTGECAHVMFIIRASAELIQASAYTSLEIRNHRSHMVRDDLQVRVLIKDTRQREPAHRYTGLIGPPKRPPQIIL